MMDAVAATSIRKARRRHVATRPQLLMRSELDGRTSAAKVFDRMVGAIEADLGGREQLSAIERTLIEAYAGSFVSLNHLNTQLMLGQAINISEHSNCASTMVRIAVRLGLERRQRDVTPSLAEYLETLAEEKADKERASSAEAETES
jgi:hypothetical protein